MRFGKWLVVAPADPRINSGWVRRYWVCQCDCGSIVEKSSDSVRRSTSCGCHKGSPEYSAAMSAAKRVHGHNGVNSPTYRSWQSMRQRCRYKKSISYPFYGAKGVTIDPRWDSFENFLADMGERPEGTTLDRINPDDHYRPGNCRWADSRTQANNRRDTNHITYNGRTQTIPEWAAEIGLERRVLYNRIVWLKWPLDRAMTP